MEVRNENGAVRRFGEHMEFSIRQLLLDATDDRGGEHDVADGAEPYEEYFFQNTIFVRQR